MKTSIVRPLNCAVVFSSVLVLARLMAGSIIGLDVVAAVCATLSCAAGNAVNDYFDVRSDAENRPERPIPSGRISREAALKISASLFALSSAAALLVNVPFFALVSAANAGLVFYSWKVGKRVLLGNALVSLILCSVVLVPALVRMTFYAEAFIAVPLFLLNMSREIAKDIEDLAGDAAQDRKSLASEKGVKTASLASAALFASALSMSVPLSIGKIAFAGVLLAVAALSAPTLARFIKHPERSSSMFQMYEKVAMVALIAGLVV